MLDLCLFFFCSPPLDSLTHSLMRLQCGEKWRTINEGCYNEWHSLSLSFSTKIIAFMSIYAASVVSCLIFKHDDGRRRKSPSTMHEKKKFFLQTFSSHTHTYTLTTHCFYFKLYDHQEKGKGDEDMNDIETKRDDYMKLNLLNLKIELKNL